MRDRKPQRISALPEGLRFNLETASLQEGNDLRECRGTSDKEKNSRPAHWPAPKLTLAGQGCETIVISDEEYTLVLKLGNFLKLGSIPIARSIKPVDAVGFTGFHPLIQPI